MKIKLAMLVLFLSVGAYTTTAQVTSKCDDSFSTFKSKVKPESYDEALALLAGIMKSCPKVSEDLYVYGETILKNKIETASSTKEEQKYVGDLLALYQQHDKNFPANANAVNVKRAMISHKYKLASDDEVYKILDAAYKKDSRSFTDYNALETYYLLFLKRYEDGKGITPEQFLETYSAVSGHAIIAYNNLVVQRDALVNKQQTLLTDDEKIFLANVPQAIEGYRAVIDNIRILGAKHLSCEKLEAFYTAAYDVNKNNLSWLEAAVSTLLNKKCFNASILQTAAQDLHALRTSSQSAFTLGTIAQRKGNGKEAVKYFEQSAELEAGMEKKAELYYTMATIVSNYDKSKAKEYAVKSSQLNPKSGRPFLFLSEMYISGTDECNLGTFDKKALAWLAIETVKKAEVAEPKFKTTVAAMEKSYVKRLPSKEEVKAAGRKKGQKITYGCWIKETITIPSL
jgi:hypothetical protein